MVFIQRVIVLLTLSLLTSYACAWSDHANLVWPLLRTLPDLQQESLRVEPLEGFLRAEAPALEALLARHEKYTVESFPHYAPRPEGLVFRADAPDLRRAFLAAIRVNPKLPYRLYRQATVEDPPVNAEQVLQHSELGLFAAGTSYTAYLKLEADERVAPAHVLATASDEPDFGMDIGLFVDNGTEFGARYGFGVQPFGNPNLPYGSQAPMHMGFYHLDWLTRTAQPDLLRSFPAWRIDLFRTLARLAFETGHDYWGWRFTGWGLHYIGDLTQPYHAQPLPGVGTAEALWLVMRGKTAEAVQRVSNRHGVLESYQYQRVSEALQRKDWQSPMLKAIASAATEQPECFDARTVQYALTRDSVMAGARLDATLEEHVPARFVSDAQFEWTGSGEESLIVATVERDKGPGAVAALDAEVIRHMRRFSRFSWMWINDALQASATGAAHRSSNSPIAEGPKAVELKSCLD